MPRRKRKCTKPTPDIPPPTFGLQIADDPTKSYLLTRLPPELRHKIYRLVLPSLTVLKPHVSDHFRDAETRERTQRPFRTHEKGTVLGLARCCKQLHGEIIPIYYGENTFSFENAYDLYRYLYMIGPENRRWVRNIQFLISGFRYSGKVMKNQDVFKLAFDVLADCLRLRKLHIGVSDQTTDGLPRKEERSLFAVKDWGVFDSMRGLGNIVAGIDLKVREVLEWDHWCSVDWENVFEMDVKNTSIWTRGLMFFQHKHVLEFERALSDEFRRPIDVQDEDVFGEGFDEEVEDIDKVKKDLVFGG
ncbi:uncharacterized protein PAC_14322 [Phialocephala subalpina]|uniref:DUF7730 domain-containing protein n=1 Tax=Phialocephala subalpina TaxID=576137 RepID=A0A1L7XHC1_9HELO|nr:uncharacterized protein PAC_14322 [Phialocephala subalpina]